MDKLLVAFTIICVLFVSSIAENIDNFDFEHFCYPEVQKNSRKLCECNNDNAPPWGLRALNIDCSYKELKTNELSEVLPLYVNTLDLSWNIMEKVPFFASDSLKLLNLMHNNITVIVEKNFVKILNLKELYLNWNSIQSIDANAFKDLVHLQVLDLSHNNLHALSSQIFAPMIVLETLNLSWNRHFNETGSIQNLDFYQTFGVTNSLKSLQLQSCSLSSLVLSMKASLIELNLRRNLFTQIPTKLPYTLEKLDFSENLFESLSANDTEQLSHVRELLFEDMPRLKSIQENFFVPLQSLNKISFQNSRRLSYLDGFAFGANSTKFPPLQNMIFRGTSLRIINSTFSPVFQQLTLLDLNGMPLHCDCELRWIKELKLETNGRCFNPSRLRGMRITNARVSDFSCDTWPKWVYCLIILALLLIFAVAIYAVVMCLRPHRGVTMRRKVGAGSPYARVTIEPNRQEDNY